MLMMCTLYHVYYWQTSVRRLKPFCNHLLRENLLQMEHFVMASYHVLMVHIQLGAIITALIGHFLPLVYTNLSGQCNIIIV